MTSAKPLTVPVPHGARTVDELFGSAPPPRRVPDARAIIRRRVRDAGAALVVLDDDPTGSQSVQHVPVLTAWSGDDVEWAYTQPSDVFFVLTNTRSLGEAETARTMRDVVNALDEVAARHVGRYISLSRGDSTLRGHFPLEVDVLASIAREHGRAYDAILIVPAYFEAGRVTSHDIHYARHGDLFIPVGSTEYARDATFGFRSSNLRHYVEEKTRGRVAAADVRSLTLDDIRLGGPERVAQILAECHGETHVVVNALVEADLEVVALAALEVEAAGTRLLYRTGPSFVPVRAGLVAHPPVTGEQIFGTARRRGHGLVIVGSHVELTNRQVAKVLDIPGMTRVELDVPALLDPAQHEDVMRRTGEDLVAALQRRDVVLVTSRSRVVGSTAASSLDIARRVSASIVRLAKKARETGVAWVIAKGGITSSDVATAGLGMRRAHVLGQLFPGIVSVWVSDDGDDLAGLPYVVFAGNVGDDDSLVQAVRVLRGGAHGA